MPGRDSLRVIEQHPARHSADRLEAVREADRERAEALRAGEAHRAIARPAQHRGEQRQLPRPSRRRHRPRRAPVAQHPLPGLGHPPTIDPALERLPRPPRRLRRRDRAAQRALRTVIARHAHQPHQPPRRNPPAGLLDPLADQPREIVSHPRTAQRRRELAGLTGRVDVALDRLVITAQQRPDSAIAAQLLIQGDQLHLGPSALHRRPPDDRRCKSTAPSSPNRTSGELSGH